MAVREMESALAGVTAGNGAIYAVRRDAYIPLPPSGSHDLSFPFALAKRGLRSLYAPGARAEEKMVPTLEGEFARKRRMMVGLWDIVVGEGMLSPRGYPPLFAFELASHRLLRYLSPLLHLRRLRRQRRPARRRLVLRPDLRRSSWPCSPPPCSAALPLAPFRVARYYVMTTASIAAGLWDRWRHGAPAAAGRRRRGPADAARPRPPDRRRSPWSSSRRFLLVAAIAIKLGSRGPVIYRQRRVGLRRPRVRDAGSCGRWCRAPTRSGSARSSPATTPGSPRAGRFLRRTSLDEVPNLVNVLRGEMAIVGPRPTIPAQVDDYTPRQHRRHEVLPGITGWAQVQGRAGIPWEERIELDVWYVEHRSLALDLRILARTALAGRHRPGPRPD